MEVPRWHCFLALLLVALLVWELARSNVWGAVQGHADVISVVEDCSPSYAECEDVVLRTALAQNTSDLVAKQAKEAREEAGVLKSRLSELEAQLGALQQAQLRNSSAEWFGCDLTQYRSDICRMIGDVRVQAETRSAVLYVQQSSTYQGITVTAKPYPAKPEPTFMAEVSTVALSSIMPRNSPDVPLQCTHRYGVPAVVFSIGGYTGVTFHTYNELLLPLYITSEHFGSEVVFLIEDTEGRAWWFKKFAPLLKELSHYPPVHLGLPDDPSVHCFSDVVVGLRYHSSLFVIADKMPGRKTTYDFAGLMSRAYGLPELPERAPGPFTKEEMRSSGRLKLALTSRASGRTISNLEEVKARAAERGFEVRVLTEEDTDEHNMQGEAGVRRVLEAMQWADVLLGVFDGALTHHILMRPGAMLVQVVPFGIKYDLPKTAYKRPALRNRLLYAEYLVPIEESSLSSEYRSEDPQIKDPLSILNSKGWHEYERIYINGQTVKLKKSTIDSLFDEIQRQLLKED